MAKKTSAMDRDMTMKIIVVAALIVTFVGGYLVARAKYKPQIVELTNMVQDKDEAMQKMKTDANRIVMREGKVWVVENGMVRELSEDLTLSNGTTVMMDGKYITSEGKEMMMQEGDAMDMEGNVLPDGGAEVKTGSTTF